MVRTLSSGTQIAGRYELQDLVSERFSSSSWRAFDSVLQRSVGIQAIGASDPRVDSFLSAARVSATVTDPRFLHVLDIIEEFNGHTYIVREWIRAYPLDHLLSESPLSSHRAAQVVQEVAEAIAHAHTHGVFHRHLTPHGVLLKNNGAVRISGLATAAALAGRFDQSKVDSYEAHDVDSLGWLLYACLTSRWPGGSIEGLRDAPRDHGTLLRPRQVTAGIPRDIDTVCDRILGRPPRHHEAPLRNASDIARELSTVLDTRLVTIDAAEHDVSRHDPVITPSGPPPGITPPRRRPKALEPPPPTALERGKEQAKSLAHGHRALIASGLLVGLVLLAVLAFLVGRATTQSSESAPQASAPAYTINRALDLDPQGDGEENPESTDLVFDSRASTGWKTDQYYNNPSFGGLKQGVGLVVDLGAPRDIGSVSVNLAQGPADVSLYGARTEVVDPPTRLDGLEKLGEASGTGVNVSFAPPGGTLTRYLIIWLTRLPEVSPGVFQGEIREVIVRPGREP